MWRADISNFAFSHEGTAFLVLDGSEGAIKKAEGVADKKGNIVGHAVMVETVIDDRGAGCVSHIAASDLVISPSSIIGDTIGSLSGLFLSSSIVKRFEEEQNTLKIWIQKC